MSERAPHRPAPDAPTAAWDTAAIAAALTAQPEATVDAVLGAGLRFRLGATQPVELDLFPAQGVVRLTGGDLQLALFRQHAGPHLAPEGLVFALPSQPAGRFLAVSSGGEVTLVLAASDAPERPRETPAVASRPDAQLDPSEPLVGHPEPPDGVLDRPLQPGVPEPERQERVRFGGRLGADVRFRETRTGRLVASFPVAVADEDGATRWERVIVFDDRARTLQGEDAPTKGRYVEVIGYRHERRETGRDGRTRTIQEVYAVVVTTR